MRTAKSSFVRWEPVQIEYEVVGPPGRPVRAVVSTHYASGQIEFEIVAPDGHKTSFSDDDGTPCYIEVESVHSAGTVARGQVSIQWNREMRSWVFPTVGRYLVNARMFVGRDPDPVFIQAESLAINIVEPTEVDIRAMRYFEPESTFMLLMRGGAGNYCEGKPGASCYEDLQRFLVTHSESAYAPHIARSLGMSIVNGFVDVSPRSDLAIRQFEFFLNQWPADPQTPNVVLILIKLFAKAGRSREARGMVGRLEKEFPDRLDLARDARDYLGSLGIALN